MDNNGKYDLIVTIIKQGYSDYVIDASKSAGATGGTVLNARGTGVHEKSSFMGINIHPEKEVVLTLVKRERRNAIMQEICDKASLNLEGNGVCLSLPVNNVTGISHVARTDLNNIKPKTEKAAKKLSRKS